MQTDSSAQPQAMPLVHTGSFQFTRLSVGSWFLYELGAGNQDLPGFITINPSRVFGGPANYGSAFLPAAYQGVRIGWEGQSLKDARFGNLSNDRLPAGLQKHQLDLHATMLPLLDLAPNERTGLWTLRAREGATGREALAYLRVTGGNYSPPRAPFPRRGGCE